MQSFFPNELVEEERLRGDPKQRLRRRLWISRVVRKITDYPTWQFIRVPNSPQACLAQQCACGCFEYCHLFSFIHTIDVHAFSHSAYFVGWTVISSMLWSGDIAASRVIEQWSVTLSIWITSMEHTKKEIRENRKEMLFLRGGVRDNPNTKTKPTAVAWKCPFGLNHFQQWRGNFFVFSKGRSIGSQNVGFQL